MTSANQAMPEPGADIPADAAGALRDGEARRGDEEAAPRPLGRKDPAAAGDAAPDDGNVRIR